MPGNKILNESYCMIFVYIYMAYKTSTINLFFCFFLISLKLGPIDINSEFVF